MIFEKPRILVVEARFYPEIADEMLKGCIAALDEAEAQVRLTQVPGAFEIPHAIALADYFSDTATGVKYDGYVALGCVIRGETTHFDYVCAESARGLMQLSIEHRMAIGYGILTCETEEQAWARARVTEGNKGADAARACLAMVEMRRKLRIGGS